MLTSIYLLACVFTKAPRIEKCMVKFCRLSSKKGRRQSGVDNVVCL